MRGSEPFLAADWRAVFLTQGLTSADAWRTRVSDPQQAVRMDQPNYRYGGEMSVFRMTLADSSGRDRSLYVKCQRGQRRRTWAHPLRGEPTLVAEFRALRRCLARGIPVAPPLFFETGPGGDGRHHSLMVSLGLDDFESLDRLDIGGMMPARRRRLITDVATTLAFMHRCRYAHRNLYPKHVFVAWRPALARFDVRFIDLEKAHRAWRPQHRLRDLESLARRSTNVGDRDRLRFLRCYLGQPRLGRAGRALARRLAGRARYGT